MTKLIAKLSLIVLLVFCLSAFAEFRIAKDRTPGGLYVVGPDISPDSLPGDYLYYSPDGGNTLELKSWVGEGDGFAFCGIAADYATGNVYKVYNEVLYHSSNYGDTWVVRLSDVYDIFTGCFSGEAYAGISADYIGKYGRTEDYWDRIDTIPLLPSESSGWLSLGYPGWNVGEFFLVSSGPGWLFYSDDTLRSRSLIHDFDYRIQFIRCGRGSDLYVLSTDSIVYSSDAGSTFVGMNSFPFQYIPSERKGTFDDFVCGNYSGILYAVKDSFYWDYDSGYVGGSIKICYSDDYGATFTCLTHTAEGITYDTLSSIEEIHPSAKPEAFAISAYPNPFNGNCRIMIDDLGTGIDAIEIYDVNGRKIDVIARSASDEAISPNQGDCRALRARNDGMGKFTWQPAPSLGSGVYLVRATAGEQTTTKRVVFLK